MRVVSDSAELFRHVSAEKAAFYRCIMDVFAAAKRQYRLQLRPDEVLAEARWPDTPPRIEDVNTALAQLAAWGNLESHPDTARVSSLSDFYRARFLYRLSQGGEAVEASLALFVQTLQRRAELQTVALEDIASRLQALQTLAGEAEADVAKIHETLRDLVRVFESLAENAQAFMAGVARSIELQQAEATAVANYKRQLIDYLERFMGDLVRRSDTIARHILALEPSIDALLHQVAARDARDAAPGDAEDRADAQTLHWNAWRERWRGLRGWFFRSGHEPSQAELLRARARSAIPQLLGAIAALNERRSGRSDRSADFRMLAGWFSACSNDGEAHRLARAAFALHPARHFSLNPAADADLPASTRWADAPPLTIHPRLREYGEAAPRGAMPRVRDRAEARARLAHELAEESLQVEAARKHLATGQPTRLSDLGELDIHAFGLFLGLLGEVLTEQAGPNTSAERRTGDGLLHINLTPLAVDSRAVINTPRGVFCRAGPFDHYHADMRQPMAAIVGRDSRSIGQQQRRFQNEEFRSAVRALLMTPLMSPDHDDFPAIRRQADALRDWFGRETGWALQIEHEGARLYKRPADLASTMRGLPFYDRRRYVLLCLACAVLERADPQITLRLLGERLLQFAAEPTLAASGFNFTLGAPHERRELVAVCRTLLDLGVLQRVAGDEGAFVHAGGDQADALYDVQRRALAGMLAAVRGPSTFRPEDAPVTLDQRLHALVDEHVADSDEGRRLVLRRQLARRLLDDPVVYTDTLDAESRAYFVNQRGAMAARLCDATGLVAEQRAEGLALVDESGSLTDVAMPAEGTDAHVTLLVAEFLATVYRQRQTDAAGATQPFAGVIREQDVVDYLREIKPRYGKYWRKSAREPGAERELAEIALDRLEKLQLIERDADTVYRRPALARFALGEAEVRDFREIRGVPTAAADNQFGPT